MDVLREKARELLEGGTVQVVIGYAAGSNDARSRAVFIRRPEQADQLIINEACRQNLATYLTKPEVRALGKPAIVARPATLRTLLQLAAENQLPDASVVAIAVSEDGTVASLADLSAMEEYVAKLPHGLPAAQEEITRIDAMPLSERWAFWQGELGRCIKCYACRAACPLCYCARCITDINQPQWIPVSSDALGNLDWNIVRAMHLVGRCVNCGSCAEACPQGIRIDLLNQALAQEALDKFGAEGGISCNRNYALSTYKPDDKEEFIR